MSSFSLSGRRILVVEDEYMLACDLQRELEDAGATVLGPVGRVDAAIDIIRLEVDINGAVVDVNLGGEMAYPVADLLIERGVPFVLTTGYDASALPPRFAAIARCEKPVTSPRSPTRSARPSGPSGRACRPRTALLTVAAGWARRAGARRRPSTMDDLEIRAREAMAAERWSVALDAYDALVVARPESPAAHVGRGRALMWLGRREAAAASFARAAEIEPGLFEAHANFAVAMRELGRGLEALEGFARALALSPGNARLRADWLLSLADVEGAESALGRLEAEGDGGAPPLAQVRGVLLERLGRFEAALEAYGRASELDPNWALPKYNRGLMRLMLRRFAEGWEDYEWRWETNARTAFRAPAPFRERIARRPTADSLRGADVLLLGEQGVGDVLMFASILPDLLARARSVSLQAEPRLMRLLRHSFPALGRAGIAPDAQVVALGSLGYAFRRRLADFPGEPYLHPTADARARARAWLGRRTTALRIGLSWRGGTGLTGIARRSIPLAALRPVLAAPDAEFVSLQYGDHSDEIEAVNRALDRPIRVPPAEALGDFDDLAGMVAELDGVLSVQTSLVHLSGGLGAPCSVMVPSTPEWRYGERGAEMPWYRSVRLIRQARADDWDPVINAAWTDLRTRARRA